MSFNCSIGHPFELYTDENEGFWMRIENIAIWLDESDFDGLTEKVNIFAEELGIKELEVIP